jgi:hypothetical protein
MAQPKRGVIRWLLGRTFYPDNSYTRDRDGDPIRPYDMSTDNLAEFMGVRVDPVGSMVEADLTPVYTSVDPSGTVSRGQNGYVLDGRLNDAFRAVNRLHTAGAPLRRASRGGDGFRAGDFLVGPTVEPAVVADVVEETGVDFMPLEVDPAAASYPLTPQRIGMYQRYYGGNMDEGWTRWLLEDFAFQYTSIVAGDLNRRFDVIILPADSKQMMTGEGREDGETSAVPPDYRSGFGDAGVAALEAFVESGGTLVTFAQAGELVLDEFDVPVRNAVEGLTGDDFWAPGSTLRVRVDVSDRFAYGMPADALATFLAGGQVYETVPGARSAAVRRLVTYVDRDVLQSGWLLGEEAIANRAGVVAVGKGSGTVLMIGFRAQHRAQTHGTFKLLFNALMDGPDAPPLSAAGGGS